MGFCKEFNEKPRTKRVNYPCRNYCLRRPFLYFYLEKLPAAVLFEKQQESKRLLVNPTAKKVATLGRDQIREIAQEKMPDLNAADIDAAMRIIEGTAPAWASMSQSELDRLENSGGRKSNIPHRR